MYMHILNEFPINEMNVIIIPGVYLMRQQTIAFLLNIEGI